MRNWAYVLAIVLVGLTIRIIVASSAPILLDESYFAYQGYLILKGQIPFVNFFSYPPVPLLGIALSTLLLGRSVLTMRLTSVIFDTATIYVVYLIAKDFFNTRVGLLSALFYSLTPMMIWYGTVAREFPVALWFLMFGFLLFERSIGGSRQYLLLCGIVIGLGWFASRIIALLGIVVLTYYLTVVLRRRISSGSFLREFVLLLLGSFLVIVPVYLFLLTRLSFSQVDLLYGFAGTSLFSPIPPLSIGLSLKILNQALVQGLPFYAPAAIYLTTLVASSVVKRKLQRILITFPSAALLVYLLIAPQSYLPNVNYGVVPLYSHFLGLIDVLGVGLILSSLAIFTLSDELAPNLLRSRKNQYLLPLLVGTILGFYEYYGWSTGAFEVDYLWETVAVCSIFAGAWASFAIAHLRSKRVPTTRSKSVGLARLAAIFCLMIILVAGYVNYYSYSNSYTGERPYPVNLVTAAAQYVASHTQAGGTIFAEPIFAYLSNRSDILNFFTLTLEYTKGGKMPGVPSGQIPTDNGFVQLMQSRNVDYIVVDERLHDVVWSSLPLTARYINTFYSPVEAFYANYSQYSLAGNLQPFPIEILNRSSYWDADNYPGYYPYFQAGLLNEQSDNPISNYTFSKSNQTYLLRDQPVISISNSVMEITATSNMSRASYIQILMPDNPYPYLDVSYSLATSSACSVDSNYTVLVGINGTWESVFSGPYNCNIAKSASIDLSAFLGRAISIRIIPQSSASSLSSPVSTAVVFQSSDTAFLSYPGLANLLSVYSTRSDLLSVFPDVGSGNITSLMGLVNWAGNVVNHDFVDSNYSELTQYAWYYTLMQVYDSRPDLQKAFPNAYGNQTSQDGLLCWVNSEVSRVFPDSSYSTLSPYASSYESMKMACQTS